MQLLNNNVLNNLHLVTTVTFCFLFPKKLRAYYELWTNQESDKRYTKFDTQMKITEKTVKSKIRIR